MRAPLLLCLLLALTTSAQATPPTDESIEQLFFVTRTQEMMDGMSARMRATLKRITASVPDAASVSEERRKVLDAMETRMIEVIGSELSWENMKPMFIRIYRETLTQEDVDGLIAFYQSPAGTAFVEKMPLITQKTMQLMQDRTGPMLTRINAATEELKAQLKTTK